MDKYLLAILGSGVDYFYEADSFPAEGDFSHGIFKGIYPGGCPLNVAAVAASKNVYVKALDMLGLNDDSTFFIIDSLKNFNIDTTNIKIEKDVVNGKVVIIITNDKRTMFVIDPIRPYFIVDENITTLLNNATYIYSLMHIINRSFETIDPLLQAKNNGAKIILDGSSKYDDPSRAQILYSLVDGLFINKTDYQRLKDISNKDPKEIIFDNNGEFIVITDGSNGSTLYMKDKQIFQKSLDNINIIDSTGAGDAFAGCFIASLLSGYSHEKALKMATINGGQACTVFGGQAGIASFEQLIDFAKEHDYEI